METIPKKVFINSLLDNYLDIDVYHDILKTYAKETISFVDFGHLNITDVSPELIKQIQHTEAEISPFHKHTIDCSDNEPSQIRRQSSTVMFSDKKITFSALKQLLVDCFSPQATSGRAYPSAGGLYPIEPLVFLFPERIHQFDGHQGGCYHFRPLSKKLQLIKTMPIDHFFNKLMHGYIDSNHWPCFGILYIANIGKAIFKYRYRGYRHALMEVGSMYQQATICSQEINLRNTVWSTFSDQELLYALALDQVTYMPLTIQFFGYSD